MSDNVAAFIAGEVPAIALWVPFNIMVRDKVPGATRLVDASAYYPQSAVLGGWVARNDFYEANKGMLAGIIRGWADANDYMVRNNTAAAAALQKNHYSQTPLADVTELFGRRRCSPRANGSGFMRTAASSNGCSRRATSSWPMQRSPMRHRLRSISTQSLYLSVIEAGRCVAIDQNA